MNTRFAHTSVTQKSHSCQNSFRNALVFFKGTFHYTWLTNLSRNCYKIPYLGFILFFFLNPTHQLYSSNFKCRKAKDPKAISFKDKEMGNFSSPRFSLAAPS